MIQTIGIVGAGQMGSGIAHICALAGYQVKLADLDQMRLQHAVLSIEKNLDRQISKQKITEDDKKRTLFLIETGIDFSLFSRCDLVIEAATENETVKKKIFSTLSNFLKKEAILVSNTSSLSLTRLGAATDRASAFMGMHFMNPVPIMPLVELIRGLATSQETFDAVHKVVEKLNKQAVISEDFPGFIVNRILIPMINEAIYALYENVASIESIDNALKLGANHPMGPLELADFIGLDTCLAIMQTLYNGFSDSKYRPCPLLINYVEAGWLGRKTNLGFYNYNTKDLTVIK